MKLSERTETVHPIFRFFCSHPFIIFHDFRRRFLWRKTYKKRMTSLSLQQYKWKFYLGQKRVDLPFVIVKICMSFYRIHRTHKMVTNRQLALTVGFGFGWWASGFFVHLCAHTLWLAPKQTAESKSFFDILSPMLVSCFNHFHSGVAVHKLLCFLSFSAFSKANALLFQSIIITFFFSFSLFLCLSFYLPTILN